ncbi:hypothetical protein D3C85_1360220 [compost metagenome]
MAAALTVPDFGVFAIMLLRIVKLIGFALASNKAYFAFPPKPLKVELVMATVGITSPAYVVLAVTKPGPAL